MRLAGWRARFAYRAIAMTTVPTTFVRLAKQRARWDRSMIRNRLRKAGLAVLDPSAWKLPQERQDRAPRALRDQVPAAVLDHGRESQPQPDAGRGLREPG